MSRRSHVGIGNGALLRGRPCASPSRPQLRGAGLAPPRRVRVFGTTAKAPTAFRTPVRRRDTGAFAERWARPGTREAGGTRLPTES